uniref:Tripartite motif-containing protein 54 n=1 Tax=Sparus aurata TaxID=8175 RepID=A0A671UAD6_SPAAU
MDCSTGPASMENLEKQLICPVCLELFSKPVVILPCQHNVCRKCASDIFQVRPGTFSGSRFRCPSCRHEVVLDRHGVFGLPRNLLVENIIDLYRQQDISTFFCIAPHMKFKDSRKNILNHDEEKINIYCLSCQTPTCSMCKVFGKHKDCEVAPLSSVYVRQKSELSDGIAMLVASNDHIQAVISQMEQICLILSLSPSLQENGQRQREQLASRFDGLVAILEERKQELVGLITRQQDDKLRHLRSLIRRQLDLNVSHLEICVDAFVVRMAAAARASNMERPELGYESMSHFVIDTDDAAVMLMNIDFWGGDDEEDDPDDGGEESELDFSSRY